MTKVSDKWMVKKEHQTRGREETQEMKTAEVMKA